MKHSIVSILAISFLFSSCITTPKELPENYGSNLNEVENYLSNQYSLVFETNFLTESPKVGLALEGVITHEESKSYFIGSKNPHSILFIFNTLRFGKAALFRFKPITNTWYSISIESGAFQTESFRAISLVRNNDPYFNVSISKGNTMFIEKSYMKRQFNFKDSEYIILVEISFDGVATVKIFNEKGQYNTFIIKDFLPDIAHDFLFKIEEGKAEIVKYQEFNM